MFSPMIKTGLSAKKMLPKEGNEVKEWALQKSQVLPLSKTLQWDPYAYTATVRIKPKFVPRPGRPLITASASGPSASPYGAVYSPFL